MTPASEFPKLLDIAIAELQASTQNVVQKCQLADYPQWMLDEQNARLVFDKPGVKSLALAVQVLGTYDTTQLGWQWAWAMGTLPTNVLRVATTAREWGIQNEIPMLTVGTVSVDEPVCWKLAAFAARLGGWPAIYRGQINTGYLYLAFAEPLA